MGILAVERKPQAMGILLCSDSRLLPKSHTQVWAAGKQDLSFSLDLQEALWLPPN